MNIIISLIFICSVLSLGVHVSIQEDMWAEKVGRWAANKGKWVKPLFTCVWCMPSIYSAIAIAFGYGIGVVKEINLELILAYPIIVCGSSIINGLIWSLINYLNKDEGS